MTPTTQNDVIRAFTAGKPGVEVTNLKTIDTKNGHVALIAYDHAVYAINKGPEVEIFINWKGRSRTSLKHIYNLINHVLEETDLIMYGNRSMKDLKDVKKE